MYFTAKDIWKNCEGVIFLEKYKCNTVLPYDVEKNNKVNVLSFMLYAQLSSHQKLHRHKCSKG